MERQRPDDPIQRLHEVAQAFPGLDALILYGSRARGDATPRSDWDLAYLASGELDVGDLHSCVVEVLGDDRVDLVDLERASGQLRCRAAGDGRTIFERAPRTVEGFRLEAIAYWLDMAPIICAEYEGAPRETLAVSPLDRGLLAERASALERHLQRVAQRLPVNADDLHPESDASDAVVLHLWQAMQIAIDLATAACVKFELGTPASYADSFARLREAGVIELDLAGRLAKAAGFRSFVAHAYERLDMRRVHDAAIHGPGDLRALPAALRNHLSA